MKIAIDIRNIGRERTGSETVVLALVKNLLIVDHKNEYFLLTDTNDQHVHSAIERSLALSEHSNAQIVSLWTPQRLWWLLWGVSAFVRREEIDVFHTEYIVPFCIPQTIRVLTHIHDVSFAVPEIRPMIGRKDLLFLDLLIGRSLRRADTIIAVSDFTRNEIVKYYNVSPTKISIITNAPQEIIQENLTQSIHKRYDLPQRYIFSLGTMQPRKNIVLLIRAFLSVADRIPDIDLVLTGTKTHNFDTAIDMILSRQPELRSRVHFTGYVDNAYIPALYENATCFVSPSLYEGFGVPLLEAFSYKTPVLCSDIPVYREVADSGALFFDPRQIDQCARAVYTVCTDEKVRAQLIGKGSQRVQFFSWQKSAKELHELFNSNTIHS